MSEELYRKIGEQFTEEHGAVVSQMFGKPCIKTSNKAFAAFGSGEMVFKVGQQELALLKDKYLGSRNWDPSGKNRAMKDWLQVPVDYTDDWILLAKQALEYVEKNK